MTAPEPGGHPAHAALAAWGIAEASIEPVLSGNINWTAVVTVGGERRVLQRVNTIFRPEVHLDIQAVGAHLTARGVLCPALLPTLAGGLWAELGGGVWRMMTFVPGSVWARAPEPATCRAAGALLGRFHAALADYTRPLHAPRLGVHDTAAHLGHLQRAVAEHPHHPAAGAVGPLAARILARARALPPLATGPARMVHGDPKLANIVFAGPHQGRALIDLDTLARMPLVLELGDALRSWCAAAPEDAAAVHMDIEHLRQAWGGWRGAAPDYLADDELATLPWALPTIALELAARFARDALQERYFAWDRARYAAAWQHHLVRASNQLALAESALAQHDAVVAILAG